MVKKHLTQIPVRHTDKVLIFALPILLTLLNSNWIFSPVTDFLPDPWFYLGYFRHFYEYAPAFPSNIHYFVERITWNIPGYYIYKILPPLYANYALHLLVCYTALFSLYGTLNILFDRRTALTTTLIMGGYPWFLRAVGWDYVDGVGIALMLLLIYILTTTIHSTNWRVLLFIAGVVHTSLLVTNLFWLGFVPGWLAYVTMLHHPISREKISKLFSQAAYFFLGSVVLTLAIAIFYHTITGKYFFLQNSFAFSAQHSHNQNLVGFISDFYGAMPPDWHVLPILVSIGSIVRMRNRGRSPHHHFFIAAVALFTLTYGWLIFWHYYGLPYLKVFLYTSFAIPAIFLLLGAILADSIKDIPDDLFNMTILGAISLMALPFLLIVVYPSFGYLQGNPVLLIFFSLVIIWRPSFGRAGVGIIPVILSLAGLLFLTGSNSYVFLPDSQKGRNNFLAIIEASDTINSYYPNHDYEGFRLWFREDQNYNTFFSLSSIYLYPWGSVIDRPRSGRIPEPVLSIQERDEIQDGDKVVIISSNSAVEEVMAEANRALAERNAVVILETTRVIRQQTLQFTLYFTKIDLTLNQ